MWLTDQMQHDVSQQLPMRHIQWLVHAVELAANPYQCEVDVATDRVGSSEAFGPRLNDPRKRRDNLKMTLPLLQRDLDWISAARLS